MQLIQDEATDDYTVSVCISPILCITYLQVANIINKMIDSEAVVFACSDSEKVDLVRCCSSYAGKGSRLLTATMLWKHYSHLLNFLDLVFYLLIHT